MAVAGEVYNARGISNEQFNMSLFCGGKQYNIYIYIPECTLFHDVIEMRYGYVIVFLRSGLRQTQNVCITFFHRRPRRWSNIVLYIVH